MSNTDCSNDGTAIIWSMSTKTSIKTVFNGTYPNDTNIQIKIKDQKQNIIIHHCIVKTTIEAL